MARIADKKRTDKVKTDRIKKENEMIRLIGEEGMSIRDACKKLGIKNHGSFFYWLTQSKILLKKYENALKAREFMWENEIIEIADNIEEGITIKENKDGIEKITGDMLNHRKLRIDSRKWLLARRQPQKYGDKIEQTQKIDQKITNETTEIVKFYLPENNRDNENADD